MKMICGFGLLLCFVAFPLSSLADSQVDQPVSLDKLKERMLGQWVYQFSLTDEKKRVKVEMDESCPSYKMICSECDDRKELKGTHRTVIYERKINVLKNFKCVHFFDNARVADVFYPVADNFSPGDTRIGIQNYGKRIKDRYNISMLDGDTLVIFNVRVHKFDGKEYGGRVKHVYKKMH